MIRSVPQFYRVYCDGAGPHDTACCMKDGTGHPMFPDAAQAATFVRDGKGGWWASPKPDEKHYCAACAKVQKEALAKAKASVQSGAPS